MSSPDPSRKNRGETFIDCERPGWEPDEPCPNCGHGNVHAIIHAGIVYRDTGGNSTKRLACTKRSVPTASGFLPCNERDVQLREK